MRGGYIRGGHSRAHDLLREEQGSRSMKKGRKEEEGAAFFGSMSLVSREEDWMVEDAEKGMKRHNEMPKCTFSDPVKGGRKPVTMEENDSLSESTSSEEEMANAEDHGATERLKRKEPEIRVKKVNGIYNFIINEVAMKNLRLPWWDTLIVKLMGRKIFRPVLTRRLETMWEKQGSLEVIELGNDFFFWLSFFHKKI
ncbi:hypothetical protein AAHE18_11G025300 [Arachis hypogaea]